MTKGGHSAIIATNGNEDCHIILRGGKTPNYDADNVNAACLEMAKAGLAQHLMIDTSHANSGRNAENQIPVCANVASQIAGGDGRIVGVMVESHLTSGRQDLKSNEALTYGQSITDGCIGWDDSIRVLEMLANAVRSRRLEAARSSFTL